MNSTQCFSSLDSHNPFKVVFIFASILCILVALPGFYSIIWFEQYGSDKKRTLINKLISSSCYAVIFCLVIVQGLYIGRFSYGPLPTKVCFLLTLAKRSVICCGFLISDVISMTRYVYIFCLKNPAAFEDDFWHAFSTLWCILMSVMFQVIRATVPGSQLVEYSLCTGEDPSSLFHLRSFGRGYVEILSLVIQMLIYIRICLFKRRMQQTIGPLSHSQHQNNIFISNLESESLTTFATNIIFVFVMAFGSVFIVIINFKSCEDFLSYPKFIVVYYMYTLYPCLSCCLVLLICFVRQGLLRQTIFREVKMLFA